jgi:hypothetical protein
MEQGSSWKDNRFVASQKFPEVYWTRRFIAAFTNARQMSLTWSSRIQSIPTHSTSWWSTLILSSHIGVGLPSGLFPSCFLTKSFKHLSPPNPRYMPRPSQSSLFYHQHNIGWAVQVIKLFIMKFFFHTPVTSSLLGPNILLKHPLPVFLPQCQRPSFTPIQKRQNYICNLL